MNPNPEVVFAEAYIVQKHLRVEEPVELWVLGSG